MATEGTGLKVCQILGSSLVFVVLFTGGVSSLIICCLLGSGVCTIGNHCELDRYVDPDIREATSFGQSFLS